MSSLIHRSIPQQKITVTHAAVDYELKTETKVSDVTLRENAVSSAQFIVNDYEGKAFLVICEIGDNVKIEYGFQGEGYTQVFGGWVTSIEPTLDMQQGEFLRVTALGYGVGLVNMLVREQYGSQSDNPTLNKIQEVLTDAGNGIIPKYVMKVMASATDSGYDLDTTKVADLASDFNYLYFPGKPAIRCLEDMVDLLRAANVPNAGGHWIIIPDGTTAYLCLATVGNHENPPADIWPTYWNTTQAASTIEVGHDMVTSAFKKQRSEGNYALYIGNFSRPANGDMWTENNSADWDVEGAMTKADENGAGLFKVNSFSIRGILPLNLDNGGLYYPDSADLNIDITKIGTKRTIPRIGFYIRVNANMRVDGTVPLIELGTGAVAANNYYYHYLNTELPATNEWRHVSYPIGPYYDMDETTRGEWRSLGAPNWADIDYIEFYCSATANDARIYIDGLYFQGIVTRAAYDSNLYPTQKCKMLTFKDDVPKDDSLVAATDTGQMAQFAKAELYRAITTPITGSIVIPMKQIIKGGQLAHIHFSKQRDGTFRIDKDMRIIQARHHIGPNGPWTYLTLTDDVLNSYPMQPADQYNAIMKAVNPGFQNRTRSSLIGSNIDIEQTVLAKGYVT